MNTVESIKKRRDKYLAKRDEHELNYQETGSASTYRTMCEYDERIDICNLAIDKLSNICKRCDIHISNCEALVKKYQSYKDQNLKISVDEVIADISGLRF